MVCYFLFWWHPFTGFGIKLMLSLNEFYCPLLFLEDFEREFGINTFKISGGLVKESQPFIYRRNLFNSKISFPGCSVHSDFLLLSHELVDCVGNLSISDCSRFIEYIVILLFTL